MPTKVRIIEQIGVNGLMLPELINRGLAANDRLKYYLALLQTAAAHAQTPNQPTADLHEEREASGIHDHMLDEVVDHSRALTPDTNLIPGAHEIFGSMAADLREMTAPLRVAVTLDGELRQRLDAYEHRLEERIAELPRDDGDRVPTRALDVIARHSGNGHDSLHQLIVDLHWELTHLQTNFAVESIEGARAYGLGDGDRPLVRAFMRGVNETAPLKFDHGGLATTATRDGDRVTIQNDLGANNSHVVVVHVSGLSATVVYNDTHRGRAAFLQQMLEGRNIQWESKPAATEGGAEMYIGRYNGEKQEDLEQYLTVLGSRLVFLIDWNRARKRLTRFVKQADAAMLLKWAADNNIGHRAFLQCGHIHLIHTALERVAPRHMRIGLRLDEMLGRDSACAFLMNVLAVTSAGLTKHRSAALIDDEIEAELLTYVETMDQTVLAAIADHAALVAALADRLRVALMHFKGQGCVEDAARVADVARAWEQRASEIVRRATRLFAQSDDGHNLRRLLTEADAAADVLEQAAFRLTLVPAQTDRKSVALLDDLADLVNQSAREYVRCIEDVRDLRRAFARPELERFLVGIDRLADLASQSDAAERAMEATLMQGSGDFREVQVLSALARSFHQAIDALARCSLIMRDYVLTTTAGGR